MRPLLARARELAQRPGATYYLIAAGAYLLLRGGSFVYTPVRVTDTPTYETTADAPLWSLSFVAGQRPFTVPLVWKLLPDDHVRITAHLFVSVVAWLTLAAAVALCLRNEPVRRVGFALVLAFSATTPIILWDPLLLSESLSLSLTALLLAAALLLVRTPTTAAAALVLAVALLWAFTRDSHAYVLAFAAVLVLLSALASSQRRLKLAVAGGAAVIVAGALVSAGHGARWYQPMRDILLNRVDHDTSMEPYFERRLGPRWRDVDARRVYGRYLLSHPRYTLGKPFVGSQDVPFSSHDSLSALLDPDLRIYDDNAADRAFPLPRALSDVLYVDGKRGVLLLLLAVSAGAAFAARRYGWTWLWAVPVAGIVSTIPHGLVAFHLSGLEVDRHALEVAVILRVSLLVLALLAVDAAVAARGAPQPSEDARDRV